MLRSDDFQNFAAGTGGPDIRIDHNVKLTSIILTEAFQERPLQRVMLTHLEFKNGAIAQIGIEQAGTAGTSH